MDSLAIFHDEFYLFFSAAAQLFNNYLIIFVVYSLSVYSAETLFKFERRTYWYDRLIAPIIIISFFIHSWLYYTGVYENDFWYFSMDFWNWISSYTNTLAIIFYVYGITFILFWGLHLFGTSIRHGIKGTSVNVIKASKKFTRVDAFVLIIIMILFLDNGYSLRLKVVARAAAKQEIAKQEISKQEISKQEISKVYNNEGN